MDNFTRYSGDWYFDTSTSFFVSGDQRNVFVPNARLRFTQIIDDVAVEKYADVATATYANGRTTVTIKTNGLYTFANCAIEKPCYTYDYVVSDTDPTFLPRDLETADLVDESITTAKLASALDLTGKDVKFAVKEGSPVNAAAATGVLTLEGNSGNTKIITIGSKVYTLKTALTEAKAVGTLTATGNAGAGNTVTIGTTTYTYVTALTDPAVANEVKIGDTASDSLDNLIAAINGAAGAGITYGTGTVAHTQVVAVAGDGDTVTVTAKTIGTAGNAIATTNVGANLGFGAGTLASGANAIANEVVIGGEATNTIDNLIAAINKATGEGTTYSTGTTASTQVTAAVGSGDTMGLTAIVKGVAANTIATTTTLTDGSFDAETLEGGINGTVGAKYELYADANYLYVAKDANTIVDQNWRRIDLGSAY